MVDSILTALNQKLERSKLRLREKRKLTAMLAETEWQLGRATEDRTRWEARLRKENRDIAALEGMSLTGLFYSILGSKDERLEEERREALAASLKFEQAVAGVAELNAEVQTLQKRLGEFSHAEKEYEQILDEKAVYLKESGDGVAAEMMEICEQLADLSSKQKELHEAILAGESAGHAVEEILQTLSSASNWGTLDMLGGGMLTTMVKHSKMDAAKQQARTTQSRLLKFREELADADERLQLSLNIDGFTTFADYFFDGLIMDWVVQSKIANAKEQCQSMQSLVRSAVSECRYRMHAIRGEFQKLESLQRQIIESA